jgi:hypothetical protein
VGGWGVKQKQTPLLTNRKTKYKHAGFFEDIITILRDEGYTRYWYKLRELIHGLYDELERKDKELNELQKALEKWEFFASYIHDITACSLTKKEIRQALNTYAKKEGDRK